jgi:hypothetical protein
MAFSFAAVPSSSPPVAFNTLDAVSVALISIEIVFSYVAMLQRSDG